MRKVIILFLVIHSLCFPSSGQGNVRMTLNYSKIDSLANTWPAKTPGGVIAVVGKGEVLYHRAFGLANLPHKIQVSSKTLFTIGAAKQFTGLAFAILADRNIISLDDDIRKFFPQLPKCFDQVTLRHLLGHTSGIWDAYNMLALAGKIPNKTLLYRNDVLAVLERQQKLEFVPGSEWRYNSTAYVLLALALEKITATPFPSWMQANIFEPLGMSNTIIESEAEEVIIGAADSYNKKNGKYITSFGNRAFYGAGDLYTTISDMAKWGHLFAPENNMMKEPKKKISTTGTLSTGKATSYGLGLFIDNHRGLKRIHHGGSHAGYRASFIYYPEIDRGLISLSNCGNLDSYGIADAVFEKYLGEQNIPAKPAEEASNKDVPSFEAPSHEDLSVYAGTYFSAEANVEFSIFIDSNRVIVKDRFGSTFPLERSGKGIFGGRQPFTRLAIIKTGDSEISGIRLDVNQTKGIWFKKIK